MKKIFLLSLITLLFSCGGSDGGSNEDTTPNNDPQGQPNNNVTIKPTVATLVFPEKDKECTEGTNFTPTTSTIEFRWNLGQNTKNIKVILTDLSSNASREITAGAVSKLKIEDIKRNNQYKWQLISINGKEETVSPEWQFYNAGVPVENYAPFPATAVSPLNEAKVTGITVDLDWEATDLDSATDIVSYDLYFGEVNPPALLSGGEGLTESEKTNISIQTGKTYYWSVTTTDKTNNKSKSEVFSFVTE